MKYNQYIKHLLTQNKSLIIAVFLAITYVLSFLHVFQRIKQMSVYELFRCFSPPVISAAIIIPCFLIMIDHGILFYSDPNVIIRCQNRSKWVFNHLVCLVFDSVIYSMYITLLSISGVIFVSGVSHFKTGFIFLFFIYIIGFYCIGVVYILLTFLSKKIIAFSMIVFICLLDINLYPPIIIMERVFPSYDYLQNNISVNLSNKFLHSVSYFIGIIIISVLLHLVSTKNKDLMGGNHYKK